jgi:hypothetical protein
MFWSHGGNKMGAFGRKRLKNLDSAKRFRAMPDFVFVAFGLDFVASGLVFVAPGFDFVAPHLDFGSDESADRRT